MCVKWCKNIKTQEKYEVKCEPKVLNYFNVAKCKRERRGVDKFTEDRADGVCWTYTITHSLSHTHTSVHRHTTHW